MYLRMVVNLSITKLSRINDYLDIAEVISKKSTCLRRNFGCVVVKDDEIISTGYNGSPRGTKNCNTDLKYCVRDNLNIERGTRYELCRAVHAEANAIISASRRDLLGSGLFLVGLEFSNRSYVSNPEPCIMCKKLIINAGIKQVIVRTSKLDYKIIEVQSWIDNDTTITGSDSYQLGGCNSSRDNYCSCDRGGN